MSRRATLDEPVVISKFWKNRRHDAVIVSLTSYKGHNLIDLRTHSTGADGKLVPTKKGLAVSILRLPELAKAIDKALVKAKELGLLDDEAVT